MKLKNFFASKNVLIAIVIILLVLFLSFLKIHNLNVAHSSFENYYKFRGCTQLLEKTDMYAICKLPSGEMIKLVQVNNRWFLDGDFGW